MAAEDQGRSPIIYRLAFISLTRLRKIPGNRYPSTTAVERDLRRVAAGRKPRGVRLGPIGRMRALLARRPDIGMAAVVALLIVFGASMLVWQLMRPEPPSVIYTDELAVAKEEWRSSLKLIDFRGRLEISFFV